MKARLRPDDNAGCPLGPDECAMAAAGLEQLRRPAAVVAWCRAVGIPCEAAAKECADLIAFFRAMAPEAEWSDPPAHEGCPLDGADLARVEEGLQQLAVPMSTIQWCKKKGIPAEASGRECDDLREFFQAVLRHGKGQQGAITGSP